jgi:hypothetical protein
MRFQVLNMLSWPKPFDQLRANGSNVTVPNP